MASRHQRRKKARAKAVYYANRSMAEKQSDYVAGIVRDNLRKPRPERSFAPSSVALVSSGGLGNHIRSRKVLPYQKHHAGDTPMAAGYKIDKSLMDMTERQLRQDMSQDFKREKPAARYPVVETD